MHGIRLRILISDTPPIPPSESSDVPPVSRSESSGAPPPSFTPLADTAEEYNPWAVTIETWHDLYPALVELVAQYYADVPPMLDLGAIARRARSRVNNADHRPVVLDYALGGASYRLELSLRPNLNGAWGAHYTGLRADYRFFECPPGSQAATVLWTTECALGADYPLPPVEYWERPRYAVALPNMMQFLPTGARYARWWLQQALTAPPAPVPELAPEALARRLSGFRVQLSRHKSAGRPGSGETSILFDGRPAAGEQPSRHFGVTCRLVSDQFSEYAALPPLDTAYRHPWDGACGKTPHCS